MPREIGRIRQRLLRGQEAQIRRAQIRRRETGPVIAVFEHDRDPLRRGGELVHDSFLQEGQAGCGVYFAGCEHDDGTAWFVICGVEEVAEAEGAGGVGRVCGVIVEVVDGDGYVVSGVEEGRVSVSFGEGWMLGEMG